MKSADSAPSGANEDRRKFLETCGKFAVVTPPVMTLLLSTSMHSQAIAKSQGGPPASHPNNGWGNGGGDGSPNGKPDKGR